MEVWKVVAQSKSVLGLPPPATTPTIVIVFVGRRLSQWRDWLAVLIGIFHLGNTKNSDLEWYGCIQSFCFILAMFCIWHC